MYCQKCGKPLTDGSAFCSYCGAQQGVAAPTQSSYGSSGPWQQTTQPSRGTTAPQPQVQPQTQPQQKPKKGWSSFLIILVVIVAARYIGKNIAAPAMTSDDNPSPSSSTKLILPSSDVWDDEESPEESGVTNVGEINQNYEDVFVTADGRRINHLSPVLFDADTMSLMSTKSFAMKDEDGTIICKDYGYLDDIVNVWIETWYYPGISADQTDYIEFLNESAEEEVARYSDVTCASVTYSYEELGGYFRIEYKFKDVDHQENYQALEDIGLVTGSGAISMSLSEKGDLDIGYIPKYVE